jgi:predicted transcriptional regulator
VVTVVVDDPVYLVATIMDMDAVRRVPVLENDRVVGIISQADLATHITEDRVGDLVEEISAAPANTGGGTAGRRKTSRLRIRQPD